MIFANPEQVDPPGVEVEDINPFDKQMGVAAQDPHIPVGARLLLSHHLWEDLFTNRYVKEVIEQGHVLPFAQIPPEFSGIIQTAASGK